KVMGTGTINDNDLPLTVSIAAPGAAATEGNPLAFTISLSAPNPGPGPITVDYTTQDVSAVAPGDYMPQTGTVIFAATEQTKNLPSVITNNDTIPESDETFNVVLSNAQGATIGSGIAAGTINDDDAPLTVAFGTPPPTAAEGASISFD